MAANRINFSSKEAYRKWNAFGHIHQVFEKTPGNQAVFIFGRRHKVKHGK